MCYCKNHGKCRRKTRHAAILIMLENPVGGLTVPKGKSHSDSQSRHCLQKPKPILCLHLCPPSTKTHPSSVSLTQGQCNHLGNRARKLADHGYMSVDDNTNWFWTPSLSSSLQPHLLPNFQSPSLNISQIHPTSLSCTVLLQQCFHRTVVLLVWGLDSYYFLCQEYPPCLPTPTFDLANFYFIIQSQQRLPFLQQSFPVATAQPTSKTSTLDQVVFLGGRFHSTLNSQHPVW